MFPPLPPPGKKDLETNGQKKEVHLLSTFAQDFYGAELRLLVLGYIRPEADYVSKEALIADIEMDIDVARRSLDREAYRAFSKDERLVPGLS